MLGLPVVARAADYQDAGQLQTELRRLVAEFPDACRLISIGQSRQGRDIVVLELGRGENLADRSAMAIVGGIDGDFPVTTAVAMGVARGLLSAGRDEPGWELLAGHTVYVVPRVNPDAVEAYFNKPLREQRLALRPWDDDRDGRIDEDGPEDLNGDGMITMMRVKIDGARVGTLEATHVPDPKEPRLLKKADRDKGETPVYALLVEGVDSDGDELYNEDGPGGVDVNRNFMHQYKEHDAGAGPHQISEPESKALIDFFWAHPRIATAVFYGRHDNVVDPPKGGGDARGGGARPPQAAAAAPRRGRGGGGRGGFVRPPSPKPPRGLHKDDVAIYKHMSERYKKLTGIKKVPSEASDGAVFGWAYAQYGIPSFACRVWTRPEPEKKKDEKPDAEEGAEDEPEDGGADAKEADKPSGADRPAGMRRGARSGRGGGGGKKEEGPADKDAAAWLKYSDEKRDGAGFVPWTSFPHPQLGAVEIGGFVPFFRTTPPAEMIEEISEKQLAFVLDLGGRFPNLAIVAPKVTALSDTVYQIETALVNDGYFPSGLGIAKENRRVRPAVVMLDVPLDRILGGTRVERIWSVPGSGGRNKLRWVVRGAAGSTVTIRLISEKYGNQQVDVTLASTPDQKEGS